MKYLKDELSAFSDQIKFALKNYNPHNLKISSFSNIIICGMGGSGIAGRIVKGYFNDKINIPIEIVSDYTLPRFAGKKTLIILSSYSGNTEETLCAYKIARESGCKIIAITTGGELKKLAEEHDMLIYNAESGFQPRMALGYPFTYMLLIIFELTGQYKTQDLENIAEYVSGVSDYINSSETFVKEILSHGNIKNKYVAVCDNYFEAAGLRFAGQIQENAKLEAFVNTIPEANHNVIESYYNHVDSNFIFINSRRSNRINSRFAFIKNLLEKHGCKTIEITTKDDSLCSLFHVIYLLDWISLQIADKVGALSNKIPNINELKNFLNQQQ